MSKSAGNSEMLLTKSYRTEYINVVPNRQRLRLRRLTLSLELPCRDTWITPGHLDSPKLALKLDRGVHNSVKRESIRTSFQCRGVRFHPLQPECPEHRGFHSQNGV